MTTPNFPHLVDDDNGEITVTVNDVEIRGWSYKDSTEQYLKIRMAREFCEGWHTGFGSGLDRAGQVVKETFGKNISPSVAPSLTVVSGDE